MADKKLDTEKILLPQTSTEENSTTCSNGSGNNPDVPASPGENDQLFSASAATNKSIEVDVKQQQQPASTNPKQKGKKLKKKKSDDKSHDESDSTNTIPPLPVYCKKCLGRNVGKKGERSDAYVITCSKCGAHEVLMKPDGNGVVKVTDPTGQALPQGDILEAAWKSAEEKLYSALQSKEKEVVEQTKQRNDQISSRITTFAQLLQDCSRECANLYPLIINLRSLQLKKTISTPQKRNVLENEVKDRISSLEKGINEIEAYEAKHFRKSLCAPNTSGSKSTNAASANPSLFDPLSPGTASSTASETGAAASDVPTSANAAPTKMKSVPWYIQKTEELNSRLEVMHCHLTKYTMMESLMIQTKMEEDIAKIKDNGEEAISSLQVFTQGLVNQCSNTTKESTRRAEMRQDFIKKKQELLAEARILAERCIANGDEEGLRRIEEMLRQNNIKN